MSPQPRKYGRRVIPTETDPGLYDQWRRNNRAKRRRLRAEAAAREAAAARAAHDRIVARILAMPIRDPDPSTESTEGVGKTTPPLAPSKSGEVQPPAQGV